MYPVKNIIFINSLLPTENNQPEQTLFFQMCSNPLCKINKVTYFSIKHSHEGNHIHVEAEAKATVVDCSFDEWKKIQQDGSSVSIDEVISFHDSLTRTDRASQIIIGASNKSVTEPPISPTPGTLPPTNKPTDIEGKVFGLPFNL